MDIQILLALQGLRESLPGAVEKIFVCMTYLGEGPLLVALALVVYWCIDKRTAEHTIFAFGLSGWACQFVKNIACVYRPWIRDAAIAPAEAAIEGATGYSFPSGHSAGVTSVFGTFAWRARKKHLAFAICCVVLILLTCFSRNFLGVHTPQDVLVGIAAAVISIVFAHMFFNWMDRYDALMPGHKKDILVMAIVVVACIASVVIVQVKPYPMDYVDGQLIVDPVTMQKGTFETAGMFAGMAVSWVLERRFVAFSTTGLAVKDRVVRGVIGVALVGICYVATDLVFKAVMPVNFAKLFAYFLVVIVGMFVAPLIFNAIEKRRQQQSR